MESNKEQACGDGICQRNEYQWPMECLKRHQHHQINDGEYCAKDNCVFWPDPTNHKGSNNVYSDSKGEEHDVVQTDTFEADALFIQKDRHKYAYQAGRK